MTDTLAEVLFYHLELKPLDAVLPALVEKSVERGWRAVIQAGSKERLEAIDQLLWTFKESSFIGHGTARTGHAQLQPVYLTIESDNPNTATVRFLVDRARLDDLPRELARHKRVVLMFDGNDADAVAEARAAWKAVKATGASATYWQQNDAGGWVKKA